MGAVGARNTHTNILYNIIHHTVCIHTSQSQAIQASHSGPCMYVCMYVCMLVCEGVPNFVCAVLSFSRAGLEICLCRSLIFPPAPPPPGPASAPPPPGPASAHPNQLPKPTTQTNPPAFKRCTLHCKLLRTDESPHPSQLPKPIPRPLNDTHPIAY